MDVLYREWKGCNKRSAREKAHRDFLGDCKYFDITPKFLRVNNRFLKNSFAGDLKIFERRLLSKMIRRKEACIQKLRKEENRAHANLSERCGEREMLIFTDKIKHVTEIERGIYTKRHRKKLKFLMRGRKIFKEDERNQVDYINMSSVDFDTYQDAVLKLGPKYILEDKIDLRETIPRIEKILEKVHLNDREKLRSKTQEIIKKHINKTERDSEDRKILKEIKNNENIACIKTDKTDKIAILDKEDYIERMNEIIWELNATELKKDPNDKLKEKEKIIIRDEKWPNNKRSFIVNHAPNTPRLFGRLKDHKKIKKMRPIVNKKEGPTYELEKYMKSIYKKIIPDSDNSLTSTEDFIQKLKDAKIHSTDTILSFDIENLYPSIDTKAIEIIVNDRIKEEFQDATIASTLISTNN